MTDVELEWSYVDTEDGETVNVHEEVTLRPADCFKVINKLVLNTNVSQKAAREIVKEEARKVVVEKEYHD